MWKQWFEECKKQCEEGEATEQDLDHEIAKVTAMHSTDMKKEDYETTLAKLHEKVQMSNAEAEAIKGSVKRFLRYYN